MKLTFLIAFASWTTFLGFRLHAQSPLKIEFIKIPAGQFTMGCSAGDILCNPDESPSHRIQITKNFEMAKYEVTQAQWTQVMQSNPSSNKGDNRPVETVSKLEV